ncbi:hypothetical protein B0H14DRAFT_2369629, partial [Mycena olivaceomarginata]
VSPAIPGIICRFQSLDEGTWIPGAYFLTQTGLILTAGQILTVFPPKYVYVCSVAIFEIGSLVCAVSPSMMALIVGWAVAGCGAGGVLTGSDHCFQVVDHVSWRWCFYINLPLGGFAILLIFGDLKTREPMSISRGKISTVRDRLAAIDWVGSVICIGMVVSLLLPLQWSGITKLWDDATVVVLFCLTALLLGIFMLWEWRKGDTALVPFTMFRRRSQFGAAFATVRFGHAPVNPGTDLLHPLLRYQAKRHSATRSGIDILPFMISVVGCNAVAEIVPGPKLGRYWHIITISPLVFSVGSGLLFTLSANSPTKRFIGYQILGQCFLCIGRI